MAKIKVKKKDPEAEQQTVAGFLRPNEPLPLIRGPYNAGDWIITEANGTRHIMSNEEFQMTYERV